MPIGFCCENCILFSSESVCVNIFSKKEITKSKTIEDKIILIHASIEDEILKIIIEQEGKRMPLHLDLNKFIASN